MALPSLCTSCFITSLHQNCNLRMEQKFALTSVSDSPRKRKYHADRASSPVEPNAKPPFGASEAQAGSHRDKRRKAGSSAGQIFRKGAANSSPLSACTLCLGRHPHNIARCDATSLWDGTSLFCKWNDKGRLLHRDGAVLCSEWQLPRSCRSSSHPQAHLCSGCGSSNHGAQDCPRAQKAA
jgi:hypothetical protein